MGKYIQGVFKPTNPSKYIGRVTNIIYRSSWELDAFRAIDKMESVVQWSSEEIVVPYILKGPRGATKVKRYFPDIFIVFKKPDGSIRKVLVEIKPFKETLPPVPKQGKKRKTLIYEAQAWNMNSAKWRAARIFCKKRGWQFEVWTEKTLYPKKQKLNEEAGKLPKLKPLTPMKKRVKK